MIMSLLKRLIRLEWCIGFIENTVEDVVAGKELQFRWVNNPYKNRWFADPFILDVTDSSYIVLVEDYDFSKGYACISKLTISKDTFNIIDVKKLLDDGSHMSFPVIIRKDDGIYVHPENSASGQLKLYKLDPVSEKLLSNSVLANLPLIDAVTLGQDACSTMFATVRDSQPNGNVLSILKKGIDGYEIIDSISFSSNIARMAGDFFYCKGKLYRPAQDCNKRYGGALIIQEIENDRATYQFRDIRRITSPHPKYKLGLHTFNTYKGAIVIDVYGYSGNHYFSSFINKLRFAILKR